MPLKGKTRITTQFNKIPKSFNTEFQFVKQRSKYAKVIDTSGKRLKRSVISNYSTLENYETKNILTGHSHIIRKKTAFFKSLKVKNYLVPSVGDITNIFTIYLKNKSNHTSVISIRDQRTKLEAGRVHIMLMPETIIQLDKFMKSTSLLSDSDLLHRLKKDKYDTNTIKQIFESPQRKLVQNQFYALKDILFAKIMVKTGFEITEFNKTALEYWTDVLKIKLRYVPNKKDGYYFNPETMEFLKK